MWSLAVDAVRPDGWSRNVQCINFATMEECMWLIFNKLFNNGLEIPVPDFGTVVKEQRYLFSIIGHERTVALLSS
jgi:hypothetical protein